MHKTSRWNKEYSMKQRLFYETKTFLFLWSSDGGVYSPYRWTAKEDETHLAPIDKLDT